MAQAVTTNTPYETALKLHAWGANVTATKDRKVIHRWKPFQTTRQSLDDVADFPWDEANMGGVIHSVGGWRCFDVDKCQSFSTVKLILERLGLPETYPWVDRSLSGKGWHIWFLCFDDIPEGVLHTEEPGVFWGLSKNDDFGHIELRWERSQTVLPTLTPDHGRWTNGVPESAPAVVSIGHVLAAFFAVATPKSKTPTKVHTPTQPVHDADDIKETIRQKIDLVEFARKYFPGEPRKERDEVRIPDHGGLLIKPETGEWYCFGDEIGGDVFDLAGYALHGTRWDNEDGTMFRAALQEAAAFAGVTLPERSNGQVVHKNSLIITNGVAPTPIEEDHGEPRRKLLHADELDSLPPQTWLIDGELPSNALAVLFGPSGSGKSFIALDEAARLAQTRNVVYVAAEGASGYGKRKNAWKQHHNQGIGKLHFWTEAVNLMNAQEVQAFIDAISHLEKPIVYIDTLARCMVGGDENSAKDMGIAIAACDTIRRATGELVKVVHHTGKNGTSERGSSALRGAADVMIEVTDDDGVITVACSKMKDAAPFEPRHYRLLPVGDSCVIVPAAHVMVTNDAPLTNKQRKVLETLALAVFEDTGAKANQLNDCVPTGTLFRVLSELKRRGYIRQADKGDPYFITEEGKRVVRALSSDIPHPKAQLSQQSSDYHTTIDSDTAVLPSLSHTFRCDSDSSSDSSSKNGKCETEKSHGHNPRPPVGTSMAVRIDIAQQRFDAARSRMASNPGSDWGPELEMLEAAERAAHGGET